MTHKTKECLSRPRKQGAKWTGKDIQADETVQNVQLGWDAKRDRWNGYDPSELQDVVDEYSSLQQVKENGINDAEKEPNSANRTEALITAHENVDMSEEGTRYEEETDMGRHQSTATRNLRIREDTAKYLLNLDLDSAKYDPKTRSMVDSGATTDQAAALVAEEGFMKSSGDAAEFDAASRAAWESQERGDRNKIHLQANPTSGEYFRRKEAEESQAKRKHQHKDLLEKYGAQEQHQRDLAKGGGVSEIDRFVEYDEKGKIKGQQPVKVKSSYAENVLINNHTSVWGSWWKDFQWGYSCCHSTVKNSYCTGEEGKIAVAEADRLENTEAISEDDAPNEELEVKKNVADSTGTDAPTAKDTTTSKRGLEEMREGVTDAEFDEYRKKRVVADDPMAALLGKDELVH